MQMFHTNSYFQLQPNRLTTVIKNDNIVLTLTTGETFTLEGVGAFIWECVRDEQTILEIHQNIMKRYQVNETQSLNDLSNFLTALLQAGLIRAIHPKTPNLNLIPENYRD